MFDSQDEPVVCRYSRRQAHAAGVLVDLTPWAREAGLLLPGED